MVHLPLKGVIGYRGLCRAGGFPELVIGSA